MSMEAEPRPIRTAHPKLDGSAPFLKAVVRQVEVEPGAQVVRQGDVPRTAHLLLEGQTFRYRLLANGRRQITAILVPGDVCDLEAVMRGRANYSVGVLTPSVLGEISADSVDGADEVEADIRRALWRQLLRDEAIAREWLVGLGRRSAKERVAHLFCELRERLQKVGLGEGDTYSFHLTQADLADVLGLSTVHVNRVLQQLRQDGLIELGRSVLHIVDPAALARLSDFDPAYLETA